MSQQEGGRSVYQVLERALARVVTDEKDLLDARDQWNREAGLVHDDETIYEERAAAFLEWYTLDRRRRGDDPHPSPAPIERLIAEAAEAREKRGSRSPHGDGKPDGGDDDTQLDGSGGEHRILVSLATSHRSIFRVRETLDDGLMLDDLWGGGLFRVRERRQLAGVERGELFDARLVADVESPLDLLFLRTFCIHPREVEAPVRAHVERSREAGEARDVLLFRLLRLRVRCLRYQHVSPSKIYAQDGTRER